MPQIFIVDSRFGVFVDDFVSESDVVCPVPVVLQPTLDILILQVFVNVFSYELAGNVELLVVILQILYVFIQFFVQGIQDVQFEFVQILYVVQWFHLPFVSEKVLFYYLVQLVILLYSLHLVYKITNTRLFLLKLILFSLLFISLIYLFL